ncbi:hypothetical protein GOBAR_AA25978 [Gossypium barbadense]|uniref:Uncharacterized protein n=1 Tax=Gossypium barbadense TaxID=3634 RepID=A0A2P5WUB7_GOSBA|nr:hypothetical protein GOBAR_AA25978 [Gossypium barbadense]
MDPSRAVNTGVAMIVLKQDKHFSQDRMTHGLRQITTTVRHGRVHHTVKEHGCVPDRGRARTCPNIEPTNKVRIADGRMPQPYF